MLLDPQTAPLPSYYLVEAYLVISVHALDQVLCLPRIFRIQEMSDFLKTEYIFLH